MAVALALSAAVVIFGFQAFSASQHAQSPGSLRAFAEDSGLFVVLGVGVGGLLLPGFVLLGYGRGAPGGWAATWASAVCGLGVMTSQVVDSADRAQAPESCVAAVMIVEVQERAEGVAAL